MPEPLFADIPPGLAWADELLTRYGRWCTTRGRGAARCGSAEGMYRAPANDDDARRVGSEQLLPALEAVKVQRSLVAVPDLQRVVLHVLYVPQRLPVEAQLRILRIAPAVCRERHAAGLRAFAHTHRMAA